MCYAIPGKLIDIKNKVGVVDYFGEKRKVFADLEGVKKGDYVYAQGGILVRKLPESEALNILNTWREAFFKLKKKDEK